MRKILKNKIVWFMVIVTASPFILLEKILKITGAMTAFSTWNKSHNERKKRLADIRRKKLVSKIKKELQCKNVSLVPAFWLGSNCNGAYSNGSIKINSKINGIAVVATAYHEDRHYQQEKTNPDCLKGYIKANDDYQGYRKQHVEKDARRYSYVMTMRYAKTEFGVIKYNVFAVLYRLTYHPWKNKNNNKTLR